MKHIRRNEIQKLQIYPKVFYDKSFYLEIGILLYCWIYLISFIILNKKQNFVIFMDKWFPPLATYRVPIIYKLTIPWFF